MERIIFVLSLCGLSFFAGLAVMNFQVWPYPIINEAKIAWDAWKKLEPESRPMNIIRNEPDATGPGGVTSLHPEAGSEPILITGGFYQNLDVCPDFGCMAWIADRNGEILHSWEADPNEVFDGIDHVDGNITDLNIYIVGVALGPDGSLIATLQGRNTAPYQIGTVKFDRDGKIVWRRFDYTHHWPTVTADGTIFVPARRDPPKTRRGVETLFRVGGRHAPLHCETGVVKWEGVRMLSPEGEVIRDFWFDEIFAAADYPGVSYALRNKCNPYHVNAIAIVTEATAAKLPRARVGDLIVSLREISSLVIIDRETGALRHVISDRFAAQHSPDVLADGRIIVFDNKGGMQATGGSRIVAIDPASGETETLFPRMPSAEALLPVFSEGAGAVEVSPDSSRIVVSDSRTGRVIEVDVASGEPLWIYEKVLNLAPFHAARGLDGHSDYVRFSTQGAEYVPEDHPILN